MSSMNRKGSLPERALLHDSERGTGGRAIAQGKITMEFSAGHLLALATGKLVDTRMEENMSKLFEKTHVKSLTIQNRFIRSATWEGWQPKRVLAPRS